MYHITQKGTGTIHTLCSDTFFSVAFMRNLPFQLRNDFHLTKMMYLSHIRTECEICVRYSYNSFYSTTQRYLSVQSGSIGSTLALLFG